MQLLQIILKVLLIDERRNIIFFFVICIEGNVSTGDVLIKDYYLLLYHLHGQSFVILMLHYYFYSIVMNYHVVFVILQSLVMYDH